MKPRIEFSITVVVVFLLSQYAQATAPTAAEMAAVNHWVGAHFQPVQKLAGDPAGKTAVPHSEPADTAMGELVVYANNDQVLLNGRSDGRPLKIGQTEFKKGLLCHAFSRIVVQLHGPGKSFSAMVGVDANAGGGSIVFSVRIAGQEALRSGVMRGGEPGLPVSVDLAGASSFTIVADDAGDGIICDHADWADAKVILADGREIWLADLPIIYVANRQPIPRNAPVAPFSFLYDGKSSDELLGEWTFSETRETIDGQRTRRTQTYVDSSTGLMVRCVAVEYADFPTVEWTLYFKNSGTKDTPILENIQSLDVQFHADQSEFLLHHNVGSPCTAGDFAPLETPLGAGASKRITAVGGRPTSSDWSYFNLEWGGKGVIIVVGWPGQWAATFSREHGDSLRVSAGQELTRFTLHPGEEVRTPLTVLQFWCDGDWIRAQNIWRRWMVTHNMPRPAGMLVPTQLGGCSGANPPRADDEIAMIDGILAQNIKLDNWILDAGWYPCGDSWVNVGTWQPDAVRFPRGLRQVADHLHDRGIEFVVWFEPERVTAGSWLTEQHPQWILGGKNGGILNLGNPDAWKWVVEHFDGLLTSQAIDVYRQDYNIDPLGYWQANDAEDRQGITEIKYITGYLAYWDELLRRHPKLWIDSCASGGRRNDLETMRRAVPLLRSDWPVLDFSPSGATGQQGQTLGLSLWLPFYGTGAGLIDPYTLRSSYSPAFRVGWEPKNKDSNIALLHRTVAEFRKISGYLLDDFYPLIPYSLADNVWCAWQFDRPATGEGVIQVFRRPASDTTSMRLKMRGLEPDATYALTDLDGAAATEITGRSLLEQGLPVTIQEKRGSAIIVYQKTP